MTPPSLPRISVVVPSYNQGHFLRECLDSIFRQQYPDLEVVVMDGGSTDSSVEIIKEYAPRLKHWQSGKDGGQSAAINAGMKHCTGDLLAWLNSDDFYWNDALWTVGRAWLAHPEHGLYIGNGFRYDQRAGTFSPFCPRHVAFNRAALTYGTDTVLQPSTFFWREAWERVEGLKPDLGYCMDWDVFLRIGKLYPAVVINEFLGVSREYEETKTSTGKMKRALEIIRMIQSHTKEEATGGSVLYMLQTLRDLAESVDTLAGAKEPLHEVVRLVGKNLGKVYGGGHGFPEKGDPQDRVYMPFADAEYPLPPGSDHGPRTTVSIVVPVVEQGELVGRTVESINNQRYPGATAVVVEGAAGERPATVINRGLATATGEILGWIEPGDELTGGALAEVGRAFAEDPELDLVYGNAVFIDGRRRLMLGDHGLFLNGFCHGKWDATGDVPAYGSDVYTVPQPTVFFRRRLLERLGPLDESLEHIGDYELFTRYARAGKVKKIERTQALCRLSEEVNTARWQEQVAELYTFCRKHWPGCLTPGYAGIVKEFVSKYMRRRFGKMPRDGRFWMRAALVALSAVTGWGNPERWWRKRLCSPRWHLPRFHLPLPWFRTSDSPPLAGPERGGKPWYAVVSLARLPAEASGSELEGREAELLRCLQETCAVEIFADEPGRAGSAGVGTVVHTPETVYRQRPGWCIPSAEHGAWRTRLTDWFRRRGLPVLGPRHPLDVSENYRRQGAFFQVAVQRCLEEVRPDFLFVCGRSNPFPLLLPLKGARPRLILFAEERQPRSPRGGLAWVATAWEARRRSRYEREVVKFFDGIIAATEEDRRRFIEDHRVPPEKVIVLEAGGQGADHLTPWLVGLVQRAEGLQTRAPQAEAA